MRFTPFRPRRVVRPSARRRQARTARAVAGLVAAALAAVALALVPARAGGDAAAAAPSAHGAPSEAGEQATAAPAARDILDVLGYRVTGGAAPDYVEDRACAVCHADLWRSYREVGMARSFYRPRPATAIEDLGTAFEDAARGNRYSMRFDGDTLRFRREQQGPDGAPINVFETTVDWVVGSGNHSRVYLTHNPAGELYQLPLAWYAATPDGQPGRWGLAPGFDRDDDLGLTRIVQRECMFCHNGYPDAPAGSDTHGAPHVFPAELPEGTGCQRCHGPGAAHARKAFGGERDPEVVRRAIVNPGRLPAARRDDICFGCHLQPSVALPGVRRFGRADYSFRPGQDLAAYLFQVDVDEERRPRHARFEINHHPYRLLQSACYQRSEGALSCLTCHDPHRKVPAAERAAHYRAACQQCHARDACARPAADPTGGDGGDGPRHDGDTGDCVSCHMSPRRPHDVVETVMTDHFIRRRPGGPELLASRDNDTPILVGLDPYWPERPPEGIEREILRTLAVLQAGLSVDAADHLERLLTRHGETVTADEPWLALARTQVRLKRFARAAPILERDFAHPGSRIAARALAAVMLGAQGHGGRAAAALEAVVAAQPERVNAHYNLGLVRFGLERFEAAAEALEETVRLRPTMAPAWRHLGRTRDRLGDLDGAAEALRRAVAVDPNDAQAVSQLVDLLERAGHGEEAERYRRHRVTIAAGGGP